VPTAAPADPQPNRIEELTRSECFELLADANLGRVAVTDDRGPVVFPVSFVLDRHTVVFRTEPGTKLHAARRGSLACFEADGTDVSGRAAWSVIVRGEITEVTDPAELARLRALPLRVRAPGAGRQGSLRQDPARGADRPPDHAGVTRWEPRSPGRVSASGITSGFGSGSSGAYPTSGSCSAGPASGWARPRWAPSSKRA
jgi:nitroimidazol reductase NimA-like FMN-containing flavoprotein (pyridoxamine 5'-phosphate oxidase superfamily)